jgi:hypothetical protein
MRSFTAPSRVIAGEGRLIETVWKLLPARPLTEAELRGKLKTIRRLTNAAGFGDLVSRLVDAGALVRLDDNRFQRASLPPNELPERAVERRAR